MPIVQKNLALTNAKVITCAKVLALNVVNVQTKHVPKLFVQTSVLVTTTNVVLFVIPVTSAWTIFVHNQSVL